ncbi:T9SS type A sorting domain-containing protein [Mariniphaga anaerophila]|nr:T9SS type A sorting domain-containing protein [Mariniphaga anaerophila]
MKGTVCVFLLFVVLFFSKITMAQVHFNPVYGHFTPPGFMNINLIEAKVNGIDLNEGDEVGIFEDEVCVGFLVLSDELGEFDDLLVAPGVAGINDPDTEKTDGFSNGRIISYKFWDASENEEIHSVAPVYYHVMSGSILANTPTFSENASAFVSLTGVHNYTPVANAGDDFEVAEGEAARLNGTKSSDYENDFLTFNWTAPDGIILDDVSSETPAFVAPEVQENTNFKFVLTVNDGESDSRPDTVEVTVLHINKTPVFNTIENVTANIGYGFSVDISVTDPDELDEISIFADDLPHWLNLVDNGDGTAVLKSDSIPKLESLLGEHSVVLKASDGHETVDLLYSFVVSVDVGITSLDDEVLSIYPNVTDKLVNIQLKSFPENGANVGVYNQLGQMVLSRQIKAQKTQLDLSGNPAGVYLVRVSFSSFQYAGKIILLQ